MARSFRRPWHTQPAVVDFNFLSLGGQTIPGHSHLSDGGSKVAAVTVSFLLVGFVGFAFETISFSKLNV